MYLLVEQRVRLIIDRGDTYRDYRIKSLSYDSNNKFLAFLHTVFTYLHNICSKPQTMCRKYTGMFRYNTLIQRCFRSVVFRTFLSQV
jgi:hypothetical protein